jgi:hypothetical protein
MNDALIRLVQEKAFQALVDMQDAGALTLGDLGFIVSKVGQVAVQQKKWMAEVKRRAEAAAQRVEKVARKGGLSEEAVAAIRREILGTTPTAG